MVRGLCCFLDPCAYEFYYNTLLHATYVIFGLVVGSLCSSTSYEIAQVATHNDDALEQAAAVLSSICGDFKTRDREERIM